MNFREKNTKITAKISDRKCEPAFLKELYEAGLDVAWFNTAHQDEEGTLYAINKVREVSDKIAIMIDTKGPEVRTINFDDEPPALKIGDKVRLTGKVELNDVPNKVYAVDYPNFHNEIPLGKQILIDDGSLGLTVEAIENEAIVCNVDNTGIIKKRKSVNVPNTHIDLPTLTAKDTAFLKFSAEQNVDFIAHSFVRSKEDVFAVRNVLDAHGGQGIKIIAKIENREGVDNIDEILDYADGVMVARGDLAVEVPAAEVPLLQKRMIESAAKRGKLSFVATQMLDSMIENPRPTRAEVSDIATAILDGADSTCLSGETAYGDYPVEAVQTMSKVSLDLKKNRVHTNPYNITDIKGATSREYFFAKSAFEAAINLDVEAIVVPTVSGKTAEHISSFRSRKPIFAFSYDDRVLRQLMAKHAVRVEKIEEIIQDTDKLVTTCVKSLIESGAVNEDSILAVVAGTTYPAPKRCSFFEIGAAKDLIKD